jgi:hypothetical protein
VSERQRQVADLVTAVLADPTGGMYGSVYETGRLVSLAPWLAGHDNRVDFLLRSQLADGSWGGPGDYAVVPTLSAVEALLTVAARENRSSLRTAAERGVAIAAKLLAAAESTGLPDTVVAPFIVPALIHDINELVGRPALRTPPQMSDEHLAELRAGAWHNPFAMYYLEIVGPQVVGSPDVTPVDGVVGCSAAATAAWLGPTRPGPERAESVRFLTELQDRLGGPIPGMTSMAWYERAWLHTALATAGFDAALIDPLLADLPDGVAENGAPAAPGFAYDAGTTAVILNAQARRRGRAEEPSWLWGFDAGTHFRTTNPEGHPSVITNSDVLRLFADYAASGPADRDRYDDAIRRITAWLVERQRPDGSWTDRWHASSLFATRCCAAALREFGGRAGAEAADRAVALVLRSQHPDGSWGEFGGTAEETAYALHVLVLAGDGGDHRDAIKAGRRYLLAEGLHEPYPALWTGKDLCAPANLVRGVVLAALQLTEDLT